MTAVSVHVLTVDADGDALVELLADAGHTVSGPDETTVAEVIDAIRRAPGADAVCVVGALGVHSALAGVLHASFEAALPGYGESLREALRVASVTGEVLMRAEAGLLGRTVVFGVPARAPKVAAEVVNRALAGLDVDDDDDAKPPIPFGGARGSNVGLMVSESRDPEPSSKSAAKTADGDAEEEGAAPGWLRAVEALKAEIMVGRQEDLPEPIEKLAPVVNVLHTAGETGTLKLPSGRRYSLWGWPDLRRPNSKVLAVSWGEPLAEIVALHRHPAEAGTCIEEGNGLLTGAVADVGEVCKRITGRAPPVTEGQLFAISGDSVWILRSRRVFKWDGSREKDDGNPKQVLSSLTLHWSNR